MLKKLSLHFKFSLILLVVLASKPFAQAQSQQRPIDETIAAAAPRLPAIEKFEGSGKSFIYKGTKYKFDEIILRKWVSDYPQELNNYMPAMAELIKATDPEKLSPGMKAIFMDLSAQFYIIKKLKIKTQ